MSSKQSKVQVSVYASKLKNVAGLGKGTSDPYCVVTLLAGSDDERAHILGRTEVVKSDLSPSWTTTFMVDYCFGKETRINLCVLDEGRKSKGNKSMGSAQFEIGEILGAKGNVKAKRFKNGGTVFVRVAKASKLDLGTFKLGLKGIKLKNMDGIFGKSDPFFVVETFAKGTQGGRKWQPVYRSEHVMNNLNPVWKECDIPLEKICSGDREQPLQIAVYDWEKNGKHQSMGKCQTNINGLLAAGSACTSFDLIRQGKGKSYGTILIEKATIEGQEMDPNIPPPKFATVKGTRQINPDYKKWQTTFGRQGGSEPFESPVQPQSSINPSSPPRRTLPPAMAPPSMVPPSMASISPKFLDYISGGTEINLSVAIDFTGSNGDPKKPGTLHHIYRDGQLNDYEKAITAVASIVARYDSDQMFSVYGFGAKFGGVINHCFQVGKSTELHGISGMIEGYRSVFASGLTMSGPTVFGDVIMQAAAVAQSKQESQSAQGKQSYSILLILTDGAVSDLEQTKQAIQYASTAPLSIVIVGVGNEDFSQMQFLDDFHVQDDAVRDIVQFVEFNQHRGDKQRLTQETLDEIPDQLVDYFVGQGIQPLPPISNSRVSIHADNHSSMRDIDLDIVEGSNGDLKLRNSSIARFDTRSYGNTSGFLSKSTGPPSTQASSGYSKLSPAPSHSSKPSHSSSGGYSGSSQPSHISSGHGNASSAPSYSSSGNSSSNSPYTSHSGAPPVMRSGTQPVTLRVKAPPNSYPGMQIRVAHPQTGQLHVVAVPAGVHAGGEFRVNL